jgi:hypothetical protein
MHQDDRLKVVNAGFTVIRSRDTGLLTKKHQRMIYASDKNNFNWHKYEGPFRYETARDRRIRVLLQNKKIISG